MSKNMKLLPVEKYADLISRVVAIPFNTFFAQAVLQLKSQGTVWVDNIDCPIVCYIAQAYGMSLLFGDHNCQGFNDDLFAYMQNKDINRKSFEWLQVYPESWHNVFNANLNNKLLRYSELEQRLPDKSIAIANAARGQKIIVWRRTNFCYNASLVKALSVAPYVVKSIDSIIYDKIVGSVIPANFWYSKETFLADGVGFALLNGERVASIAFSSFKSSTHLEIGVETMRDYQNLGLGKLICSIIIDHCMKNNFIPVWACRKENISSSRLAQSLGFEDVLTLPYYELIMD